LQAGGEEVGEFAGGEFFGEVGGGFEDDAVEAWIGEEFAELGDGGLAGACGA
jgi:hypothetical protein